MASFDAALPWVLRHEGGYSDHPADKGGKTMMGVTQATLNRFNREHPELAMPGDVAGLHLAHVREIYRLGYWRFDKVESQKVATKTLDMAVNMGLTQGVRLLQRALNALGAALEEDGIWGGWTALATNAADPDALVLELVKQQAAFYRYLVEKDADQAVFLRGWIARATAVPPCA